MAPTATTLYVHRSRWTMNLAPSPERVIWTAHRPLRGATAWEGPNVGWGCHFAAADRDDIRFDYFEEQNGKDDARLVALVDNQQAITEASRQCKELGREAYGLGAYVKAYPGREGAKMFVETYDLPWDDADASADALLAALATA